MPELVYLGVMKQTQPRPVLSPTPPFADASEAEMEEWSERWWAWAHDGGLPKSWFEPATD